MYGKLLEKLEMWFVWIINHILSWLFDSIGLIL
jgi:hypothetical protein